jgi:hypothetical protein
VIVEGLLGAHFGNDKPVKLFIFLGLLPLTPGLFFKCLEILIKSIIRIERFEPVLIVGHHYYFVPHPSEFDCITNVQFQTLPWHQTMLRVTLYMSHDEPQLLGWRLLLFVRGLDSVLVVDPIV